MLKCAEIVDRIREVTLMERLTYAVHYLVFGRPTKLNGPDVREQCISFLTLFNINTSQGSVATRLRYDGIFSDNCIANLLPSVLYL